MRPRHAVGGALALVAAAGITATQRECPVPPTPTPSPTATVSPAPTPTPSPDCLPGVPWCGETGQECSSPAAPCKHNPTSDPAHCELAPPCAAPTPTPAPIPGCVLSGDPGSPIPGYVNRLGHDVNEAMAQLRQDCNVGGRCVLQEGRQAWQTRVSAELRRRGICAGQHGPTTDEIAVASVATSAWEGWHIYAGPEAGPGTVVWSPQAARGAYAAPDTEPPPAGACPPPRPAAIGQSGGLGRIGLQKHGPWLDATPQVYAGSPSEVPPGETYCVKSGYGVALWCPFRPEGHPDRQACELEGLGGEYQWQTEPIPDRAIVNPDNPAQASCAGCQLLRVCSARGEVCSEWVEAP